jgi:hypothetical protein
LIGCIIESYRPKLTESGIIPVLLTITASKDIEMKVHAVKIIKYLSEKG